LKRKKDDPGEGRYWKKKELPMRVTALYWGEKARGFAGEKESLSNFNEFQKF